MQASKPSGWAVRESVAASIKAGDVNKLNKMHGDHAAPGPLSEVAGITQAKKPVLGF
ncbi:hypothetical protein HR059_31320 (plasmid) [Sinorhizobium meliloti WSM1022]|uniref:hypothetical protein n=1 Tax=Rhizobium meliloti TaxID=382 RepID=UPI00041AAAB8|nr:hypothetical protein [Sinorhizobium meliloti]MDE3831378.1 hypothetical protein [Sinorhizobium meliloti]MDE4579061.1 hypothetical protein [Sinorhizobium meliloti]MDW9627761.1 hypothetical protein [Sinorhizobium meliloti]MDW9714069.1 hypothetical protein [Sinorhizobium meliloti]MDW9751178.1 hypothetical protein [Sinorhizobium meliloti]